MRVLLIEDDEGIAQSIAQGLVEAGYTVTLAHDGASGLRRAISSRFDVLIIDIQLPTLDGISVLEHVRDNGLTMPILLLTARDAVDDRVRGLDAGADDYVVKPFAFTELLARLRALLRRQHASIDTVLTLADIEFDYARRTVRRAGKSIELSPREWTLLEYLLRHPGQVLTRTQIAEHVWDVDFYSESNVVDVYIGYLRRKLDDPFEQKLIHTIRGVGYWLGNEGV